MKTTVGDIYKLIDLLAAFDSSEDWDNSGLIIGDRNTSVTKILVALDVTREVIKEAAELGAQLIVTHHPVIFSPMKRIEGDSIPALCIKNNLSVICAHTNLDVAVGGVNDVLAEALGLKDIAVLCPSEGADHVVVTVMAPQSDGDKIKSAAFEAGAGNIGNYSRCSFSYSGKGSFLSESGAKPTIGEIGKTESVEETAVTFVCKKRDLSAVVAAVRAAHSYEEPVLYLHEDLTPKKGGLGRIGRLDSPMPAAAFGTYVKAKLRCENVRYSTGRQVKTVAVCGGSGGDLILQALAAGCDALVTGDVKLSAFLEAKHRGLTLVDAGHFETENVIIGPLTRYLKEKLPDLEVTASKKSTAPYKAV